MEMKAFSQKTAGQVPKFSKAEKATVRGVLRSFDREIVFAERGDKYRRVATPNRVPVGNPANGEEALCSRFEKPQRLRSACRQKQASRTAAAVRAERQSLRANLHFKRAVR
ncbi:hypothetical protein K0M31_010220 [Melipona bicolor]|uniref:Uncharacterized protein n=1 Tax=Melipona bicolor TaxID=60889 RepID=A0AA40KIF5_9HYME|nr:hypothetical protein K0M31_010220 [Melipona bicolor]